MNDGNAVSHSQRVIEEAAANYVPHCPPKYEMLMQFQESIATLRRKGASYRTITEILHTVNVSVSLDTVARFCREVVEQRQPRKARRRSFVRPPSERITQTTRGDHGPNSPNENGARDAITDRSTKEPPVRTKGPRIADPTNL
jgi:hypothetical protein